MADDHNDSDVSQELGYFGGAHPIMHDQNGWLLCGYSGGNVCAAALAAGIIEIDWRVETWYPGDDPEPFWMQDANSKLPEPPGIPQSAYDVNVVLKPFPIWGLATPAPPGADVTPKESEDMVIEGSDGQYDLVSGGKITTIALLDALVLHQGTGEFLKDPPNGLPWVKLGALTRDILAKRLWTRV